MLNSTLNESNQRKNQPIEITLPNGTLENKTLKLSHLQIESIEIEIRPETKKQLKTREMQTSLLQRKRLPDDSINKTIEEQGQEEVSQKYIARIKELEEGENSMRKEVEELKEDLEKAQQKEIEYIKGRISQCRQSDLKKISKETLNKLKRELDSCQKECNEFIHLKELHSTFNVMDRICLSQLFELEGLETILGNPSIMLEGEEPTNINHQ